MPVFKKIHNRIIYPSTFASFFNQISGVRSPKLDFIKNNLVTGPVALMDLITYVTHLDETSHMSAEFVFRYGPKCMGGLILPILVLLHL